MSDEMVGEFPENDMPPEGFKTWQEYYAYNDDLNEYNRLKAQRDRFAELDARFGANKAARPSVRPNVNKPVQASVQGKSAKNPWPNSIYAQAHASNGDYIQTSKGVVQLDNRQIAWAKQYIANKARPAAGSNADGTDATTINQVPAAQYKADPKVAELTKEVAALKQRLSAKEAELNKLLGK